MHARVWLPLLAAAAALALLSRRQPAESLSLSQDAPVALPSRLGEGAKPAPAQALASEVTAADAAGEAAAASQLNAARTQAKALASQLEACTEAARAAPASGAVFAPAVSDEEAGQLFPLPAESLDAASRLGRARLCEVGAVGVPPSAECSALRTSMSCGGQDLMSTLAVAPGPLHECSAEELLLAIRYVVATRVSSSVVD
jgi:hypothetical protein